MKESIKRLKLMKKLQTKIITTYYLKNISYMSKYVRFIYNNYNTINLLNSNKSCFCCLTKTFEKFKKNSCF